MAFTTSVCLFITITAAVPKPVCLATKSSKSIITNLFGNQRSGRASRNHAKEVVPTSNDSSTMPFNQFLQCDAHFLLNSAWVVHMSADVEQFGSTVSLTSK